MTIKQFIEKAIGGGWKPKASWFGDVPIDSSGYHTVLLNPEAWKAVGKVEGWNVTTYKQTVPARIVSRVSRKGVVKYSVPAHIRMMKKPNARWKREMHRMIDALAEGKTIEQYLETL